MIYEKYNIRKQSNCLLQKPWNDCCKQHFIFLKKQTQNVNTKLDSLTGKNSSILHYVCILKKNDNN